MKVKFEPLALKDVDWAALDRFPDRNVFQTRPWLDFVAETQGGQPLIVAIRDDGVTLGYFTGLQVRKWGFRILGSPFAGWATESMGFNLPADMPRTPILKEFLPFVFKELGCQRFEIMERLCNDPECAALNPDRRDYRTFELDLSGSEEALLAAMDSSCRQCIRKAQRSGVVIEEAQDLGFAEDYCAQLKDVFAKQTLVPTYGIERVRALIQHLLPTGQLQILRARGPDGRCLATGIFLGMNRTVYFWGAASWRRDQPLRPNQLLLWHAIRHWKARGMTLMDMCGAGEYKRRYGAREVPRPWLGFSKHPFLSCLIHAAKTAVDARQKLLGAICGRGLLRLPAGGACAASERDS